MTRGLSVLVAALMCLTTMSRLSAQSVTLASDLMKDWKAQKETMMKIADAMPEEKFGFKATPPERSYAEQILHVAGANIMLMRFLGPKATSPITINGADLSTFGIKASSKAEVLKVLSDSYDYGEAVLKEF